MSETNGAAPERRPWQLELDEYIRQGEPGRVQKAESWQTAIGLQQVDGLEVSDYLIDTAKLHVEVNRRKTEEADLVSQRIVELLGERAFTLSPVAWMGIHRRLFEGIFDGVGEVRDYNITKKEWVLNGDTVTYAPCTDLIPTLDYDFGREKDFSYDDLSVSEAVDHIARFIAGVWQIHPFCEGNTRSTAVLLIKYLRSMGFEVTNEPFEKNSWFFRNALVRANYTNYETSVRPTIKPLTDFLENVMLGTHHPLLNRTLHVDYVQPTGAGAETTGQVTDQVTDQVTVHVTDQVGAYVFALLVQLKEGPKSASQLLKDMGLTHRPSFRETYLNPALEAGLIERTIPDKPRSRLQQYRLTDAGRKVLTQ